MLRALQRLSLRVSQQILHFLQGFKAKVVEQVVAIIIDFRIDFVTMGLAEFHQFLGDIAEWLARFIHGLIRQLVDDLSEFVRGIAVMIGNSDAGGQGSIIEIGCHKRNGKLRGKFIELRGFDTIVDSKERPLGDQGRIHFQALCCQLDSIQYLIERYILVLAVALYHLHTNHGHVSGIVQRYTMF